jgi:hypothetical protein
MKDTAKVVAKGFVGFVFALVISAMLIHGKDTPQPMTAQQQLQEQADLENRQQHAFDNHAISKRLIPPNSTALCNHKNEIIGYRYKSGTRASEPIYFEGDVFDNLQAEMPCW